MEEYENLYDKLREILGKDLSDLNIIESQIDVQLQNEYFEFSKKISEECGGDWAIEKAGYLDDPEYSIEVKKTLLARLATIENITAYKLIENYMNHPDDDLKDWGELALQESKMHLQSHLMDDAQVFISTGLGGRDNKLRYYLVLVERERNTFSKFQVDIIKKEFTYGIEKLGGEIEDYDSSGYLAAFMLLLPIKCPIRNAFNDVIEECNQFGNFLNNNCIITNVKKLTFEEVKAFIEDNNSHE